MSNYFANLNSLPDRHTHNEACVDNVVYLDNAASTHPWPEVVNIVCDLMSNEYANPSSSHKLGRQARALVEQSRCVIADALKVEPEEIYFCSGGTEANNLAICGAVWANASSKNRSIVCSTLEHPSVVKTIRTLRRSGWRTDYVDFRNGTCNEKQLQHILTSNPILLSFMAVQNELGYKLPIQQIADLRDKLAPSALFHVDAVQAFGRIEFLPKKYGIDLASTSAHKLGGPKGIGALFVKRGTKLFTTAAGGGQERGLRSGTEALPLIVGFAKAVELTMAQSATLEQHARTLNNELQRRLKSAFKDVLINSREDGSPYICSFSLPQWNNDEVLGYLSDRGIFLSASSACSTNHKNVPKGTWRKKHPLVLQLAGLPKQANTTTYRASFFVETTLQDVRDLVDTLVQYEKDVSK